MAIPLGRDLFVRREKKAAPSCWHRGDADYATIAPMPAIDDDTWEQLCSRHSNVRLSRDAFAEFLEGRAFVSDHLEDLFLACAASRNDAAALAIFESQHVSMLRKVLRKTLSPDGPQSVEDLLQGLRERLFSGTLDDPPRIVAYSGRGALKAWLRMVAVRHATDQARKKSETPTDFDLEDLPNDAPGADPELAYLRAKYRDVFRDAFKSALASLAPEERNVLRYHYLDGLSIDQIGAIYGLHRVSASRRIHRAREALVDATRSELRRTHFETPSELESVLRAVQSEVALSLETLFDASPSSM